MLITVSANPFIKLPTSEPMAYAIFSRIGIPLSRNSSSCGQASINAPIAMAKAPIPTINNVSAAIACTPIIASGPTNAKITITPAITSNNVDNAVAFSVAF